MSELKECIMHGSHYLEWAQIIYAKREFVNIKTPAGSTHRHLLTPTPSVGRFDEFQISINLTHSKRVYLNPDSTSLCPFRFTTTHPFGFINSYISAPVLIKKGSLNEFIVDTGQSLDLSWVDPLLADIQPFMLALPHLFTFITSDGFMDVTILQSDVVLEWLNLVTENKPFHVDFPQPGKQFRKELHDTPELILSAETLNLFNERCMNHFKFYPLTKLKQINVIIRYVTPKTIIYHTP